MDESGDSRVIGRIAPGEEDALSELYRRHAKVLYAYALRVLRSEEDAQEAVSALFLSVWSGIPAWPDPAPAPGIVLAGRLRDSLTGRLRAGGAAAFRDVDLWSVVSARVFDDPTLEAARRVIGKCGVVSTAVLSLVYFSGQTVAGAARKLSMTESECRSRLQMCLGRLAGGGDGPESDRRATVHGGRFSACSAAMALGAMVPADDPAYAEHLAGGCAACEEETARYAAAAHILPRLLPELRLPGDLLEKILFTVRLAQIAAPDDAPAAGPPPLRRHGARRRRTAIPRRPASARRAGIARFAGAIAAAAILVLASYVRTLNERLEEQNGLNESLQERHTDLLLRYDRLAGISGFFESKGVVTMLNGSPGYSGLTGKIVWDTSGKSAMLQILNPPGDLGNGRIRVTAIGDDESVRIAEFRGDARDRGGALYRFFPVEVGSSFRPGGFAVDVSPGTDGAHGEFRNVLLGEIAGRQ